MITSLIEMLELPNFGQTPSVANFGDIIKFVTIFTKAIFKDSKTLKELENMYQNEIYIIIE